MKPLTKVFLLFLCLPFYAPSLRAEDISNIFCDALAKEESYDRHNLKSYKILTRAENGWIYRTPNDFKTEFYPDKPVIGQMKKLTEAFAAHGIDFIIVHPPTRGIDNKKEWKKYTSDIRAIRKQGIHITGISDAQNANPYFYTRDHHWNAAGARKAAEELAAYIKTLDVYQSLPKKQYRTRHDGTAPHKSAAAKAFKMICNTTLPPEPAEIFVTEPEEQSKDKDALFGEDEIPQIVLTGTSNCVDSAQANFEGFLKEYLSADILNLSQAGKGVDNPLLDYLSSENFKNHKPKIIIWEVPGYYNFKYAIKKIYGPALNILEKGHAG